MNPTVPAEHDPYSFEYAEILTSYLKHLTTLSTGALALQIAFLEKIFPHPKWKAFVVISLVSFTVSIVWSASTYMAVIVLTVRARLSSAERAFSVKIARGSFLTAYIGFLLGIIAIVIFVLRNLFTLT